LNALSQTPAFNFLEVVSGLAQTRGSANHKAFGIFLATHNQETSQITMGGWAEHHMHDEIHWSSVLEPEHGHWLLEIKSLRVDGETIPYCQEGCKAVVDSGTSLLSVPTPFFPELYGLLKHPASLEGDCVANSPQLEIELEGFTVVLDGGDFARLDEHGPSGKPSWGKKAFSAEDKTRPDMTCKPMLMVMDLPEPIGPKLFILGEPALKKYYTVYDAEKQRIGFSRARHAPKVPAPNDDETWFVKAEEEFAEEEAKNPESSLESTSQEQESNLESTSHEQVESREYETEARTEGDEQQDSQDDEDDEEGLEGDEGVSDPEARMEEDPLAESELEDPESEGHIEEELEDQAEEEMVHHGQDPSELGAGYEDDRPQSLDASAHDEHGVEPDVESEMQDVVSGADAEVDDAQKEDFSDAEVDDAQKEDFFGDYGNRDIQDQDEERVMQETMAAEDWIPNAVPQEPVEFGAHSHEEVWSHPTPSAQGTISCGGHYADTCADCSEGGGAAWCNGDCTWTSEGCTLAIVDSDASQHAGAEAQSEAEHLPISKSLTQQLADIVPRSSEEEHAAWRHQVLELTGGATKAPASDLQQQVSELLGFGTETALQRKLANLMGLPVS